MVKDQSYYDDNTLFKVLHALKEGGFSDFQASEAVRILQNAGILFRERVRLTTCRRDYTHGRHEWYDDRDKQVKDCDGRLQPLPLTNSEGLPNAEHQDSES